MNCLSQMVKYLLYLLNVVFVAAGILLIVVGSIMLDGMGTFNSFSDTFNARTIPICVIVVGCIIFVVAFFGCCGTIRENSCCTIIYAVCMFILFALQLALSIWLFVENSSFADRISEVVNKAWLENDDANGYPMDALQLTFNCCGRNSYRDYVGNVPASCCGYTDRGKSCSAAIYESRPGCYQKFNDFWTTNADIISWSSLFISLFELGIFIFACCLASAMRKR